MNKIEINSVYSNRFGGAEYMEIVDDFKTLGLPVEFTNFTQILLPIFMSIMSCVFIGRRYIAFNTQPDGTVTIECVIAVDNKTRPYLNISVCIGNDAIVHSLRANFLSRKLQGVYQEYVPGQNDKGIDCLPYSGLRDATKKLLRELTVKRSAFFKALMIRTNGLAGQLMGSGESDFQMLDCPQDGIFKAYRIYRDFLNNPIFSVCIQSHMPAILEVDNPEFAMSMGFAEDGTSLTRN